MDNQTTSVQDPSDMSISRNDDGFEQETEANVELAQDHNEAQRDASHENPGQDIPVPKIGME